MPFGKEWVMLGDAQTGQTILRVDDIVRADVRPAPVAALWLAGEEARLSMTNGTTFSLSAECWAKLKGELWPEFAC